MNMNCKLITLIAVLAVCVSGVIIVASETDSADAADVDASYSLSTESVTVGVAYSRTITAQSPVAPSYFTLTGANWLTLATNSLTVSGTPTTAGTYTVTLTGPILNGAVTAEWVWTINVVNGTTYTVTVINNGSTIASTTVASGGTYKLPTLSNTSTQVFNGYYTAASGGSYVGASGESITVTSNRTVYAQWGSAATAVSITLDFNGYYFHPYGTLYASSSISQKDPGTTFYFSVADATVNSGYMFDEDTNELSTKTFLGWATSPTGTPVTYTSFTVTTAATYYAIWAEETEELSFLGGTNSVIVVSGDSYSYTPDTNIEAAVISYSTTVSWLSFSNGTLSGTVPTITSATSYNVVLTATSSNPTQTATQNITFYVYPSLAYIGEPVTSMYMGESYDYDLTTYLSGVTYTLTGVDWLTVSNGHIVGSAPLQDTAYTVQYTIKATHSASGQTTTKDVILYVNEALEFTTVPTSSFVASQVATNEQYQSFIVEYLEGLFTTASASSGDIDYVFNGGCVKFIFTGTNAESLKWYVNGELESEDWTFVREFDNGTYEISCMAENDLGTSEVFSVTIDIEKPFMGLTIVDYAIILIILLGALLAIKKIREKKGVC